jgi:hypothetical protein
MMPDPAPDMLAAALAAYDAGICVVRARTDGSKRPVGDWAQWQERRPSREQVAAWFADGHAAMGAVCGAVSGDLEMFELEGRFMERFGSVEFMERAQRFGVELTLKRMLSGLVVISPSDGRHFIVRIEGPVDGNTKLARDADGNTLIETRGEGGFVVLPPSHGTTHPSGRPWRAREGGDVATIVTLTADERDRLFALARSYDETPSPVAPPPVTASQRAKLGRYGGAASSSWIDMVVDHLSTAWTMRALLEHYGWTWCYTDRHGRELLRRPGKDEGVSGSVNGSGRFHPFSSTTPFPSARADKGAPTYDHLDVLATYEHSGDRQAAAKAVAEATGIMDAWKRAKDDAVADAMHYTGSATPPNVDPDTGEMHDEPPAATDDLFDARPVLRHIRQAARARLVSPWAVLGCVMARVAAFTPPSTCLPPIVGSVAPLSLYVSLWGNSGAGKSSPESCARDLIPFVPVGCVGPLGLGSGEGLVEAFMDMIEELDDNGKKKTVKKQKFHGALFTVDEGQMLAEIGSRKGSTILPVLRTAWSGNNPGQANASIETRRSLTPGSYHVGLVSLWQTKAAASLLADVDGGTPQRFVWLPTNDPGASWKDRPDWPGGLSWMPPAPIRLDGVVRHHPLELAEPIADEVGEARAAVLRGDLVDSPLDAHRRLNKLKIAGVLALLDNRNDVTVDDWDLAERILTISDGIRDWVLAETRRAEAAKVSAEVDRAVYRETAIQDSALTRALRSAAKAAHRAAVKAAPDPATRRVISVAMASRDRRLVTVDEAVAEAERLEWITGSGDAWTPGKARPA